MVYLCDLFLALPLNPLIFAYPTKSLIQTCQIKAFLPWSVLITNMCFFQISKCKLIILDSLSCRFESKIFCHRDMAKDPQTYYAFHHMTRIPLVFYYSRSHWFGWINYNRFFFTSLYKPTTVPPNLFVCVWKKSMLDFVILDSEGVLNWDRSKWHWNLWSRVPTRSCVDKLTVRSLDLYIWYPLPWSI